MHTGKPMDTTETNGQNDGSSETGNDFGRRNPLEIGVQLRNLVNRGDFLTAQYKGGQLVPGFSMSTCAGARSSSIGARSPSRTVACSPRHAVPFTRSRTACGSNSRPARRAKRFEGRPAFEAEFPEVLFYVQRREYFRVDAPVIDPYICSGRLPDGERSASKCTTCRSAASACAPRTPAWRIADGLRLQDCE